METFTDRVERFCATVEQYCEAVEPAFNRLFRWSFTGLFVLIITALGTGSLAGAMMMQHQRHACETSQAWANIECGHIALLPPVRVPFPEAQR